MKCETCGQSLPRADADLDAAIAAMLDGATLLDIAEQWGVSRESVRVALTTRRAKEYATVQSARRARLADYETARNERRARLRAERMVPCVVCGTPAFQHVPAHSVACCSPDHRRIFLALRQHLPGNRETQRRQSAEWTVRNSADPVKVRSAQRLLDGTNRTHGRWLQQGSGAHGAAIEAHAAGWPIFDALPEQIRLQIGGLR